MAGSCRCLLLLFLPIITVHGNVRLSYDVMEEQRNREFIGNVGSDTRLRANLSAEEFGNLRFSLLPQRNSYSNMFRVEERSGILETTTKLDREAICGQVSVCRLNMSVAVLSTVTDFFRIVNVSVTVADMNDNSPVFPNSDMQVVFSESAKIGDSFQLQPAVDQDVGVNGEISYQLQGSDGTFGLQHNTSPGGISDLRIIVNRQLDHETSPQQLLTLVASDGGFPTNIATASVTVSITDINDHAPIFALKLYQQKILESTPVRTTLLQVSATDTDRGTNGKVSYYISPLTSKIVRDKFFLNATSGDLVLQEPLNYENAQTYVFNVEARDGGNPPKVGQTNIVINILDVNDNAPAIKFNIPDGQVFVSVPESLSPGDYLTQMSVFDGDSGRGGQVICQLTGTRFKLVHVFGSEFKILVNSKLDRESEPELNVTVTCTDRGSPPKQDVRTLIVRVRDVNDMVPKFPQNQYNLDISETARSGDVLMKATAEDNDLGEAGRVTFRLNATGGQYFQILNNGNIIVNSNVDRETTPTIVFEVIAMDNATPFHSSTATVSVVVLDVNDEVPDFGATSLELSVSENLPSGTSVGIVTAVDPDLGPGGLVSYSLSSASSDTPFSIDADTGEITTAQKLDREEVGKYMLSVLATDKGDPQLTSTLSLIISVTDSNDNKPTFTFPTGSNNTVSIYNSHKLGRLVTRVSASDSDDKNNSKLEYTFMGNGPPYSYFNLDPDSGMITLAKPLGGREKQTMELVIIATDNGTPRYSSEVRLFIVARRDTRPLPMPDGLSGKTNLTIAICILAVSAIVSGTIVIIICLVKRRGNKQPKDPSKSEEAKSEKNRNSLYDAKKTGSADIIINREGVSQIASPPNLHPVPSQLENDDVYKHHEPSNPTFQIFPVQDHFPPKMGYTEDLAKSDGLSDSSTGDSGRGLSQDDIQWLHQHQDCDHLQSLEEERYSQSSVPSHDLTASDQTSPDYRWSGRRGPSQAMSPQHARSPAQSIHPPRFMHSSPANSNYRSPSHPQSGQSYMSSFS